MLAGIKLEFSFELTEPEFSSEIPKPSSVVSPVTVEINAAVLPSLKHLQLHQNFHHNGYYHSPADSDWGCFRGCAISSSLGAPF